MSCSLGFLCLSVVIFLTQIKKTFVFCIFAIIQTFMPINRNEGEAKIQQQQQHMLPYQMAEQSRETLNMVEKIQNRLLLR